MIKFNMEQEAKNKAIRLYKNKSLTLREISNLVGVCETYLQLLYREEFKNGTLKPRCPHSALKPRTPNGQGKKQLPSGIGKGGRNHERKKFTEEQELEIVKDYYETGMASVDLQEKWDIHPKQLQILRKKYGAKYGRKKRTKPNNKKS